MPSHISNFPSSGNSHLPSLRRCIPRSSSGLVIGDLPESTRDITTYLHQRFARLQDTHHALSHIDTSWPGEDVIRQLVERACGQFIFAVTIMKYLESDDELPTERLEDIIHIRGDDLPESSYPDLDLLYHQVLETCFNWQEVRKILRLLVTIPRVNLANFILPTDPWAPTLNRIYNSPECIGALLDCKLGRVQSLLFKLHSVIVVPMDSREDMQIPHVSFTEFLLDSTRSRGYHVEPYTETVYYDLVAQSFLRALSTRSLEYPCRVSQSISLWDNWDFLNSGLSVLSVFYLVRYLMSPSDDATSVEDTDETSKASKRQRRRKREASPSISSVESASQRKRRWSTSIFLIHAPIPAELDTTNAV